MKTKLLIYSLFLISSVSFAQIVANQVDDFESSLNNWTLGNPAVAAAQISNPADGGPDGAGDAFFSYVTTGSSNGPGSKMLIFTRNAQWSGDFAGQGVVAIKMDVRATTGDLNLRIGLSDQDSNTFPSTQMVTTNTVVVTAGSGWQTVTIPIQPSDFSVLAGGSGLTPAQVLGSVVEMRIFSNTSVSWLGQSGARTMDLNDITASTTLSTTEVLSNNEFSISPNPATSRLNVYLPQNSINATIAVYDVLGKRVYSNQLDALTSTIDVSKWNTGVYLVRISTDNSTQTKRFVKQ
ncbi:T9SS type A sorting domain-containing protein [Psychroserpens sp.]|uniref:T9SS type A sorting domain-containing protein n=1 Tax=Psychroserpens sp. TaxID=2020870 RepID=UPI002B26A883|nr:T9SS type A sorting domain-containing protein [Psychroserpens sp.]